MNNIGLKNWVPILFSFHNVPITFQRWYPWRHILLLIFPNLTSHTIRAFWSFIALYTTTNTLYWVFFQQLQQITTVRIFNFEQRKGLFANVLAYFWLLLCSMSANGFGQLSSRRSRYQYPNYRLLCRTLFRQLIPAQNIQVYHTVCVHLYDFTKPKINNSKISLIINQNIFGLHVSINDVVAVNVRKCTNDACAIKPCRLNIYRSILLFFQVWKQLAPADHLEKHIQCLLVLKCCFQM